MTNPAAGVMATSPATKPEHKPSSEGRPRTVHSPNIQVMAPAATTTKHCWHFGPTLTPFLCFEKLSFGYRESLGDVITHDQMTMVVLWRMFGRYRIAKTAPSDGT